MDDSTGDQVVERGPQKRAKTGGRQASPFLSVLRSRGLTPSQCNQFVWRLNGVKRYCMTNTPWTSIE